MNAYSKLRIAIVVHGRFHAFDLLKALSARPDVDVQLLTNYRASECAKFGIAPALVSSFFVHRMLQAFLNRVAPWFFPLWMERYLCEIFGAWAANRLARQAHKPHLIRVFSGVAEEILLDPRLQACKKVLTRGSSHISTQYTLLHEEEIRARTILAELADSAVQKINKPKINKPSAWMMARELREYQLSDAVLVLSQFAEKSFLQHGFDPQRLMTIPNAVNLSWFAADAATMQAREQRLRSGAPLRVLMVGSFSFRKGIIDFANVVKHFKSSHFKSSHLKRNMQFRFVGDMPTEGLAIQAMLLPDVEFRERIAPQQLAQEYAWGDVFLFPTIEDGFPAVLSQALAAGLCVITTPNGSGPDLIRNAEQGWIVEARDTQAMINCLETLDQDRELLLRCAHAAHASIAERSWDDVAADFVASVKAKWTFDN